MTSKRQQRRRACTDKQRYATQQAAVSRAFQWGKQAGQWITAYKCQWCGYFHIGHPPARVRQGIAERRANG